jgi:hypothetical protein
MSGAFSPKSKVWAGKINRYFCVINRQTGCNELVGQCVLKQNTGILA